MAGHSKWAQIKRKKGVKDKARGQEFTKLARFITIAVAEGGGITDPALNFKLRLAVERARAGNMPKDNIERAIARGVGPDRAQLKEVFYEAFGPGGVMLIIQATTDNQNRTLTEVRSTLEHKGGGKLGAQGSVMYAFTKCTVATFEKNVNSEEAVYEFAQAINALDITEDETTFTVYMPFEEMGRVGDLRGDLKLSSGPELDFMPANPVSIEDVRTASNLLSLVESLESLDDVAQVFGNFEIPDQFMNA